MHIVRAQKVELLWQAYKSKTGTNKPKPHLDGGPITYQQKAMRIAGIGWDPLKICETNLLLVGDRIR